MITQLPQIVTLVLLACVGAVCADAQDSAGNTRRGDYGFGTRDKPRTTTEFYTKKSSEQDDRSNTEKYGTPWSPGEIAVPGETYATDEAATQAVPIVSGKIIEWTDEGVCEFRADSGDRYHVRLWLVDMPKEGQPNHEELMKFARSHDIYGEGCGNVKLGIIAENPAHPEYKIGILTTSSSSSCQEAFWKSGYCGLDDSEKEINRNESEATRLQRIFSRVQKEKDAPKISPAADSAEEPTDNEDDDESTPAPETGEDTSPATKQPEDKGVHVPGFGSQTPRDDALKGILIDLSHQPPKKGLHTSTSSRGAYEEKIKYESRESQSKRLRESIQSLSTTWNINNIKNKHLVSPTTRYTTSIYIPTSSSGTAYGSNSHGFTVPAGESSRSMPCWLCYYEGYFGVPEEGNYRFVGYAEYVMLVGVDLGGTGKKTQTVLYAFKPKEGFGAAVKCGKDWEPSRFCGAPGIGNDGEEVAREESKDKCLYKGSWLHLVPDKRYFIKIAFGTLSDNMRARLGIQKKDRDTDENFPLFTLEKVRFPVNYSSSFGSRSPGGPRGTSWDPREKGRYNSTSTCVFAPPPEQPKVVKPKAEPATATETSSGTTKKRKAKKHTEGDSPNPSQSGS